MAEHAPGDGLHPLLAEVVVCPACHGPLTVSAVDLTCPACRLAYPLRDGIPVLLVDEAVPIEGER